MKNVLFLAAALICGNIYAQEEKSVLANTPTLAEPTTEKVQSSAVTVVEPQATAATCTNGSCGKKVTYRGKHNIAPNAVPTGVEVARCETCRDACCNPVTVRTSQGVEICAPACPCKEDVRTSLNGKRKVYDYGKYEVIVTDRADSVDVRYRKRLIAR
jgi:hypothetical protein